MQKLQSLPWTDPLAFAASPEVSQATEGADWVLLYSAIRTSYSGRYSYLALHPAETIRGNDFSVLAATFAAKTPCFDNAWFGTLGYGLKNSLETLRSDSPNPISLPNLTMIRFETIVQFDHDEQRVDVWSERENPLPFLRITPPVFPSLPKVNGLASNMTRESYLAKVASIIERIRAGDLYQANLTRKFTGEFATPSDPLALFHALCTVSPACYSAFLKLGDNYVLSSSPELFLNIDAEGHIRTRPIKGTAPRSDNPVTDRQSCLALAQSTKDRAENLMIVDLMRNDLSRACVIGSVQTNSLFEVTSHASVHHMSSTITGNKRADCSTLEAISHCFPPGSMTGTPKIKAMNLCSELEILERGIYSGAIGWLGGDGSGELSVVIRTLILRGKQFEFQVGGAIVIDSIPEQELQETIDKAAGILASLGLSPFDMAV